VPGGIALSREELRSQGAVGWEITFSGFQRFSGECRVEVPILHVRKGKVVAVPEQWFMVAGAR
jgi:hypothetical protein